MRVPFVEKFEDEDSYLRFEFRVVPLWEQPVEAILSSGVGMLPLAPLCAVTQGALPGVIRQMEHRIEESAPTEAAALWTSTYVLMGLRYPRELAAQLLKGVRAMKESSTYQAILEEGEARGEARWRAEQERVLLIRLGRKRFGEPDAFTLAAIQAIATLEKLDQLSDRLLEVESWADLLA
jgi:predicted transposase YdaD